MKEKPGSQSIDNFNQNVSTIYTKSKEVSRYYPIKS